MFFNDRRNASSRLMERSFNQGPLRWMQVRQRRQNGGTGGWMGIFARALFAAFLIGPRAVGGCARKPPDNPAGLAGAAAPGSPQDFVVNVGDRVFFETDSTDLTPQSRSTLDKQAPWLQQ